MNIHFTTVTGRRDANEDKHNIFLNINGKDKTKCPINLLGIYDGHGGDEVSKYLSDNIQKLYCLQELTPPFSKKFHNTIFEHLQKNILNTKHGQSMGSTCSLNIMYKYKNECHMNFVNLGDSRAIIIYDNGIVEQVTRDHKPEDIIEKKRIEKVGGEVYKDSESIFRIGNLSVARSFGDGDTKHISQNPDVYYKKILDKTKYIVMACDGLWDVIKNDELFSILQTYKKNKCKNFACELASEALKRKSTDNISLIIIEIL